MRDTKERLSLLWTFALLNYLYADVIALWAIVAARSARVLVLRNDRNRGHVGHHLAGVDLVRS